MRALKSIFILLLWSLSLPAVFAQKTPNWSLSIANHYSHSFFSKKNDNPNISGHYGYGGELLYHIGEQEKRMNFAIGLNYLRIGQKEAYTWDTESADQISNTHFVAIPLYVFLDLKSLWYAGISASLDAPFLTSWSSIHYDQNGQELMRHSGSSTPHLLLTSSIGFGTLIGRKIILKNGLSLFVEARFKVFDILPIIEDDESDLFSYQTPFLLGINLGISF